MSTFPDIIIYTSGSKADVGYLKGFAELFGLPAERIEYQRLAEPAPALVAEAARRLDEERARRPFGVPEVWVLFSREGEPDFQSACSEARMRGLKLAVSSPVAELWYLQHLTDAYPGSAEVCGELEGTVSSVTTMKRMRSSDGVMRMQKKTVTVTLHRIISDGEAVRTMVNALSGGFKKSGRDLAPKLTAVPGGLARAFAANDGKDPVKLRRASGMPALLLRLLLLKYPDEAEARRLIDRVTPEAFERLKARRAAAAGKAGGKAKSKSKAGGKKKNRRSDK